MQRQDTTGCIVSVFCVNEREGQTCSQQCWCNEVTWEWY